MAQPCKRYIITLVLLWVGGFLVGLGVGLTAAPSACPEDVWCVPMTEIKPPPEPDISPLRLDA